MKHSSLRATRWILVNIVGTLFAYVVALIATFFLAGLLRLRFSPALGFAAFQFLFGGVFGLTIASFQSIVLDPEGPRRVRWVVFTSLGFSMGFFVANSLDLIVKGTEDSLPGFVAGIIMGLCVGIAQWLAIGPYVQRSVLWASASGIAWTIAIGIFGLGPILAAVTNPRAGENLSRSNPPRKKAAIRATT